MLGDMQNNLRREVVLPYVGYTGMCHPTGYTFCFSHSGTGYETHPPSLEDEYTLLHFD